MTTVCSRCGTAALQGDELCRACGAPLADMRPDQRSSPETLAAPSAEPQASAAPPAAQAPSPAPAAVPSAVAPTPVASPPAPPVATVAPGPQPAPGFPPTPQWPPTPPTTYAYPYGAYPLSPLYWPYGWAGAPAAYAGYLPAGYGGYFPYAYYPPKPRPAPGNGYRLFLGWFVSIGSGLTLLGGLLFTLLFVLALSSGFDGLATLGSVVGITLVPLAGGAVGLYLGIRALLKRPSVRFTLPRWLILAAITLLALGGEIVVWNVSPVPGNVWAVLPLFVLCGLLPALTILAFANGRLANPSTWRHVLLSMFYGAAVATLIAGILNEVAYVVVVLIMQALGFQVTIDLNFIQDLNPSNPNQAIVFLLVGSVAAPIIEETTKPLAAILAIPRLRSAGEAFLVGMAAGIGFAFVETLQYFGLGQADWISIAIDRLGAGLLHGVGAGMTALGWYLLIRGKGVPGRWLKGFGAILYAILQHALFNGSNLLTAIPGVSQWSQSSFDLGHLPLTADLLITFIIYGVIAAVLIVITSRLRKGVLLAEREPDQSAPGAALVPTAPVVAQGGPR
jgi:RsiW-degrading membrane proteinase PrsW (M82 family)